jgi:hypothetical protein
VEDLRDDSIHAHAMLHLRKNKRAVAPHFFGVVFHHVQVRADTGCQIGLVDHE